MSLIARMLDANFNRAREALRVMEDAARFALNDEGLCSALKSLRHELRDAATQLFCDGVLEANRDIENDVGTHISTSSEMSRSGLLDVVVAAGKRLSESLRVIEELSKVSDPRSARTHQQSKGNGGCEIASRIEALRYRAYSLDAQLQMRFGSGRAQQWHVCVLLTTALCKRPWQHVLRDAIDAGAHCVQVREKNLDGVELVDHVREVIDIARPCATVIVNDRVDVALAAGADGVHVGQHDLSVADVRRIAGRSLIVGVSTHNLHEARAAIEAGADYCGVGMMFPSALKINLSASGPDYLRAFVRNFPQMPHLAIGGITEHNVPQLVEAGARGIAVSTAVCASDEPGAVVRALSAALDRKPAEAAAESAQRAMTH